MKHWTFFITLLVFALSSIGLSASKFAYVDLQKALQSVEAGKTAKTQLEGEVEKKKSLLDKEKAALEKEAEDFEKKSAIMNEAARMKKQGELQKRFVEWQRKAAEIQMSLQKKERDLTEPLIKELRAIIEGIGKERSYQFILEKNEGAVLYAEDGADITEEVIEKFNSKRKK